jgi:iron complex outermembrane receptor protein
MPQGTLSAADFGGSLSSGNYIPSSDGADWKDFQAFNSSANGFNYQDYTDSMIEQERRSLFTASRYEINNSITAFFEGTYGQTFNSYNMAPAPMNAANEKHQLTYSVSNEHNPFGRDLNSVKRRFNELGSRKMLSENTMFRMVTGFEGEFDNGWYWDASFNYGESNTVQNTKNIVNKTRLRMAMGDSAACEAVGCVPIDLFGSNSITPGMADWISTDGTEQGTAGIRSFTTNITGELFDTGTLGLSFASGLEYRQEYIKFLPGGEYQNNDTIGGTNLKPSKGDREVAELYTELLMPLWDGLFDIELAGRYSHYNDFGSTFNPKLGLKFRPMNEVLLRASVAKGFRAPSLLEMHRGEAESFDYLNDPCQEEKNVGSGTYNCTKQADDSIEQFTTFYGGNEDLDPERSTSLTVGMVFTPEVFDGFNFKLDYFRVSTEDAISVDADYILDQYRQGNGYQNLVTVDDVTNNVLQVSSPYQNLAKREVRGVDFGVDTLFSLDQGDLTLRFEATRFLEFRTQGSKEAPYENVVGQYSRDSGGGMGSIPEIKGHFDVVYSTQDWSYSWITNYVSKLNEYSGSEKNVMEEWVTFDARLGYSYEPWGLDLAFGVDNLTDREPPQTLQGNDNIDSKTHSLIGRYFYAQVGVQLF